MRSKTRKRQKERKRKKRNRVHLITGHAAQNAKVLVYTKHQPVTSYNAHFNPKQADLRAMLKKKSHFSGSSIGECSWTLLLHISFPTTLPEAVNVGLI